MQKYFVEARQLLALAIPVILAQVAQTAMGFVDTVMAGGYSATDMAAVAIGTSIWLPAILFGHGLLLALTPVVAQLNGSGRRERIAPQVRQGFWLAGFVSVLIMVVLWNAGYIISSMHNIDPLLAEKAVGYLRGYKDTRSIFFITFTAYWVLGLPSGYLLALTDMIVPRMGPAGFWCGFIIGLTSAAIMMMLRMRFLQRQPSSIILQRAAR